MERLFFMMQGMEKISEGTLFHDAKIGDWVFYYPDQDIELRVAYDKRGRGYT